jgi:hypothetical protein
MERAVSSWLAASMLIAVGTMHSATVVGQTPEEQKLWEVQRAQIHADEKAKADLLAKQRDARKADPMAWVRALDPMTEGGWVFRAVGADGSWATFSTEHQMKRSGHQVTVWLRQEYPEPQRSADGDFFASDVEKIQYDCTKAKAQVLLAIYYTQNNLSGNQQTEEADPKQAAWDAIVPGTQSEIIFRWACATGSTGARPG